MGRFALDSDFTIRSKKQLIECIERFCTKLASTNLRCVPDTATRHRPQPHGISIDKSSGTIHIDFELIVWVDDPYLDNYDDSFGEHRLKGVSSSPRIKPEYYELITKSCLEVFGHKEIDWAGGWGRTRFSINMINTTIKVKGYDDSQITEYGNFA